MIDCLTTLQHKIGHWRLHSVFAQTELYKRTCQVKQPAQVTKDGQCGVRLSDRKASAELLSRLDIESVSVVVKRGRLRWFGHVERKQPDDWCLHAEI